MGSFCIACVFSRAVTGHLRVMRQCRADHALCFGALPPSIALNVPLSTAEPTTETDELLALVRAQFLPQARSVRHLSGERDLNFLVEVAGATERYVLKVSEPSENPAALSLQNAAMEHLALHAPQLAVQRIHRWRNGAHLLALPGPDGERLARILTYLPGLPLHAAPASAAQRRSIGATLGELDMALKDFVHPVVGNAALLWDLHRTAELQAWLPAIQQAQSRAWGAIVFDQFLQEVQPVLQSLPQQFLHNDFNPHNLLVDPAQPEQVCGVLDFGDMLHGPRVFDAAVGASYQVHEQGQPRIDSLLEFMQGYQQANPLTARELRLLPLLAAVRCAITLCITEQRALWFPQNRSYILRNHAVASAGLRALMELGLSATADSLLQHVQPLPSGDAL
jgi:Ser/Thr protein kinase RdoA (MazF antagonist)